MITGLEIVVVIAAAVSVFFIVRPYVPAWAWFTGAVGVAFYWFLDLIGKGPESQNVGGIVIFGAVALVTWWKALRRGRDRRRQGP